MITNTGTLLCHSEPVEGSSESAPPLLPTVPSPSPVFWLLTAFIHLHSSFILFFNSCSQMRTTRQPCLLMYKGDPDAHTCFLRRVYQDEKQTAAMIWVQDSIFLKGFFS